MGDAVTNRKESPANLMRPRVSVLKTQTLFLPPTYLNKVSNSSISLYLFIYFFLRKTWVRLQYLWLQKCCLFNPCFLLLSNNSGSFCCYCCSVAKTSLTPCDPMDCSTPGFSVLHYLPECAQIHVYWVSDAIQPSHLLLPTSPFAFNLPQHQGLFQELALCIRWPKYCSFSFSISPSNKYSGLI